LSAAVVEATSAFLILLSIHFIRDGIDTMLQRYEQCKHYFDLLPTDYNYLSHHAYYWLGVACSQAARKE
jgi:hypothetical protein